MSSPWIDRLGGLASLTCAIHCAVLAFAPAVIALLGMEILASEAFEWVFLSAAVLFAAVAAFVGFRAHRSPWILIGFGAGVTLLICARMVEMFSLFEGGSIIAILGGGVLVGFHMANTIVHTRLRRLRAAEACC